MRGAGQQNGRSVHRRPSPQVNRGNRTMLNGTEEPPLPMSVLPSARDACGLRKLAFTRGSDSVVLNLKVLRKCQFLAFSWFLIAEK